MRYMYKDLGASSRGSTLRARRRRRAKRRLPSGGGSGGATAGRSAQATRVDTMYVGYCLRVTLTLTDVVWVTARLQLYKSTVMCGVMILLLPPAYRCSF